MYPCMDTPCAVGSSGPGPILLPLESYKKHFEGCCSLVSAPCPCLLPDELGWEQSPLTPQQPVLSWWISSRIPLDSRNNSQHLSVGGIGECEPSVSCPRSTSQAGGLGQSLPCLEEMGKESRRSRWDWTSCSLGPCKEPESQQGDILCGPAMEPGCPGLWRGTLVALYNVTSWASWHFSASPLSLLTHSCAALSPYTFP